MTLKIYEEACLRGVRLAFQRHRAFTGGFALSKAPEAYIQGEIAASLAKATKCPVTLETSVYDTLYEARVERRGQLPRNARGRIDIVTWWKNHSPRVLIEVKKTSGHDSINEDAKRLRKVLGRGGSMREGLVIVYSQAQRKSTLERRFESIQIKSKTKASSRTGPVKFFDAFTDEVWYWEAACYVVKIERKNKFGIQANPPAKTQEVSST